MLVSYRPLARSALRKARHRAYSVGELTDQSFPVSKYCCDAHERFSKAFAATSNCFQLRMEIPRALQDYLGSGADDAAPCILTIVDGPMRTRSGLQREDDDDGAAPAEDVVVASTTYRSAPRAAPATARATRRGGRSNSRP